MTRNAPADFPREIPNHAVGSWLARIGPRSRIWAPPARRRRDPPARRHPRTGAGDEVIMSIAGHVSRAMLSRYSHVRMEAKRRALDEIAARQNAADAKR